MTNTLLKKRGASYWGTETIDKKNKKHYQKALMRGNGDLVLTKESLTFTRWLPRKEFKIPIDKIVKVKLRRWHHLGSAIFMPILAISYKVNNEIKILGVCVGWKKQAEVWKDSIEKIIKK